MKPTCIADLDMVVSYIREEVYELGLKMACNSVGPPSSLKYTFVSWVY